MAKPTTFKNLDFCSTMEELKQHHAQIIKLGLSSDNDAMGRVIKFCAVSQPGDLRYALKLFASLPQPDAFIYNTMYRGYLQSQLHTHCISLYSHMLENSVTPNNYSFPPVIRACSDCGGATEGGKQVHAHMIKFGFFQDSYCQNNLIRMYARFKELEEARRVFDGMERKDDVSWTTMISGYSQWGCLDEALHIFEMMDVKNSAAWNAVIAAHVQNNRFHDAFKLFGRMIEENMEMDSFVAASMLAACTGLGALERGKWIHKRMESRGIKIDTKLATTLMDMYCKCGRLDKAIEVFDGLCIKGVSSWNCMIGGFAMHGRGREAIELLKRMEAEARKPDHVTFVNVLAACAHSGMVEEGRHYFSYMTEAYGIAPRMEHYGCLVDLLGRAGLLDRARRVIDEMPMNPDVGVLGALLGACRIHGNLEMAEEIGQQVIELEPGNSGRYVLLANLYAKEGRLEDVARVRKLMNDRGVKKVAGSSTIELAGRVCEFVAGGRAHPEAREIYAKVGEIVRRIRDFGYVIDSEGMLYDVGEEESENPLHYHSEKLAIAYGLLKTKPGETIRITKNLRVCKDCHEASKLISNAYDREIIVRDRNRFHHFKGGVCSCNDYW
ncbi:pentatricopeptide repeat-containing protein-like protein [Salvia divinorum]|uniref:Pentatricopeptide repeat-containing protein-like protein n=1 Tax=Salvia divinorum TaxID=28513 RepID=A0ABD1INS1_SALDI